MADEDMNRPYIGYRSAGRRPESQQDRRASADAPLAALRGFLSGVLGAPGDIESLVRMLPGLSERTVFPTSADVESRLPLRTVSETPVGRVATTGGQLAGGFYNGPGSPLRVIAKAPSIAGRAGREFLQSNVPVHVVKPKGGNWIGQSIEEGLSPLKRPLGLSSTDDLREYLETARAEFPDLVPQYEQQLRERIPKEAINKWIEGPLTKYVKTYMGTPEDPVRVMIERRAGAAQSAYQTAADEANKQLTRAAQIRAEGPRPGMPPGIWEGAIDRAQYQGETGLQAAEDALRMSEKSQAHVPLEDFWALGDPTYTPWPVRKAREKAGFPVEGMAQSPAAKGWERGSDLMVKSTPAGEVASRFPGYAESNPWLSKLDPNEPVYTLGSLGEDPAGAGLPELVNTLEYALNPRTRMPEHLRLKPEDLAGYSMEKAAQRAADIHAWQAEQQAARDAAKAAKLAQSPAVQTFKEYPESARGLRWVEITKPKTDLPKGWQLKEAPWGGDFEVLDDTGVQRAVGTSADEALSKIRGSEGTRLLEEQLKNEGRLMDNCVGGYCSKVESGKTKIYSLRDAKGNPHVTVEVAPPTESAYDYWTQTKGLGPESDEFDQWVAANKGSLPKGGYDAWYRRWAKETGREVMEPPPSIIQIKGKQNKAPGEQYLPYVQDFVKSGRWADIGDIKNAGMRQWTERVQDLPSGLMGGMPRFEDIPRGYYTEDELSGLIKDWQQKTGNAPRFAAGGLVNAEPVSYNPDLVDSMVEQLRTELMHGQ